MTARRILLYMMMLLCTSLVFAQEVKVGSYTFPKNGAKYYGELVKGRPHGKGKTTFKSGDTYEGEYVNGMRQGYGIYTFTDGERYEGNWLQDHQHGKGVYYFVNQEWKKYDGMWYIDYMQGSGTMYYNNGDVYEGEWMQDKREGKGKYTWAKGCYYSNGHGELLYTWTHDCYYEGDWKDDMKSGKGMFDWRDGSRYEGDVYNDSYNGQGRYTFKNGDLYVGGWKDNRMHGKGIYKFKNGDLYEGDYLNGERTGQGIFTYADKRKYAGQFKNGLMDGFGTYTWPDGSRYEGYWAKDKKQGRGKFTSANGDVYDGTWENDHLISSFQENIEKQPLWTGTGFAINEKYIATNYHVVENAKSIWVVGVGGDSNTKYKGTIVTTDKKSDLAIIKITDTRFQTLGIIPYQIMTNQAEMGEDVFVLGYPLIDAMGDNIKLTTGIISSKTGYQGDISTYQISAPIQPGNSGGPLFNSRGNVIGIVNAKLGNAENVSYAIKTLYLKNLVDSYGNITLSNRNTLQQQSLPDKVKVLKKYIYLIECY